MRTRIIYALLALAAITITGCSSTMTVTVPVPPKVDLSEYHTIGLVAFTSNGNEELARLSAQRFMQAVHSAQPGTRIVELGSEAKVLKSVQSKSWDAQTVRALKSAHGVDAIIIGRLDVEQTKPGVQLSTRLKDLSVRSDVSASLGAKLMEADSGASIWTDFAQCSANVAHANFNKHGKGHFAASDPDAIHAQMIAQLVNEITDDFRVQYMTRRVPKEQMQTASAAGQ